MNTPLLNVRNLHVAFTTPDGPITAVNSINFSLADGETLGIVGESGSGKSQTLLAILGLLASNGRVTGSAQFDGQELIGQPEARLNRIRGDNIGLIFQDPMTSLNPYLSIGAQMTEVLIVHRAMSQRDATTEALKLLDAVNIPDARQRLKRYPHEFSGGQRQRIMIAMALLCRPKLLIADEPTTALDVTVQAQILALLNELKHEFGLSMILVTHDLGVAAQVCQHIQVMYHGDIVETADTHTLFTQPQHAYTRALLACIPNLNNTNQGRLATIADEMHGSTPSTHTKAITPVTIDRSQPLLRVDNLSVKFPLQHGWLNRSSSFTAVDSVSFELFRGETLGIVGESGSGKSTLARSILGLNQPASGTITFKDTELTGLSRKAFRPWRKIVQVVFQDPLASLNPRMTIGNIIAEPLQTFDKTLNKAARLQRVTAMLELVGLTAQQINRYPHEFSGGQCQRIGIARALILKPELLVCDEPVSALDVSVQAQVINLLMDLQAELGLTMLFIAHDLSVVKHISHRVMVMCKSKMVEIADRDTLYQHPQHEYTQQLIAAIPKL